MEIKSLNQLNPNPSNPRTLSKEDARYLKDSMDRWGDLSGIILNVRSGQLVGGHMRVATFNNKSTAKEVIITERLPEADRVGTVAYGYVVVDGVKFSYREVDWDEPNEAAANIAANKIQGDWDMQALAESNYGLSQSSPELLAMTGQSQKELERLAKMVGSTDDEEINQANQDQETDDNAKKTFKLTPSQMDVVDRSLGMVKRKNNLDFSDDGTALFYLARYYLDQHKDEPMDAGERLDDV